MPLRLKKLFASIGIFLFVILWIFVGVSVSSLIPRNPVAELIYYAIVGLGWGLPLFPVIKWMETTKGRDAKGSR